MRGFFSLFQPFYIFLSSTLFSDWLFTGNQSIWNAPIFCLHNCTGVVESKQHLPKHAPLILQGAGSQRAMIKLVSQNPSILKSNDQIGVPEHSHFHYLSCIELFVQQFHTYYTGMLGGIPWCCLHENRELFSPT